MCEQLRNRDWTSAIVDLFELEDVLVEVGLQLLNGIVDAELTCWCANN